MENKIIICQVVFMIIVFIFSSCDDVKPVQVINESKIEIDSIYVDIDGLSAVMNIKSSYWHPSHQEYKDYLDTINYSLKISPKNLFSENNENPYCRNSNHDTVTLCRSEKVNLSNPDMVGSDDVLIIFYSIINQKIKQFKEIRIIDNSDRKTRPSVYEDPSYSNTSFNVLFSFKDVSYIEDSLTNKIIIDINKNEFLNKLTTIQYQLNSEGQMGHYTSSSLYKKLLSIYELSENFKCKIVLKKLNF